MTRDEFLQALSKALEAMPQSEIDRTLSYFDEMIADRMEEGMTEEEAVAQMEPVDEIALRLLQSMPLPTLVREKVRSCGRLSPLTIVLLILGSPVWLPLLLSGIVILLAVYAVIWSLVAVLYAVVFCIAAAGLACVVFSVLLFFRSVPVGLLALGAGLTLMGLAIFSWWPARYAVKGLVSLTVFLARGVKSIFIKRRNKE